MGKAAQAQAGRDRARESRLKAARESRLKLGPDQLARERRIDEAVVDVEVAWANRTEAEQAVVDAEVAAAAAIERLLAERGGSADRGRATGRPAGVPFGDRLFRREQGREAQSAKNLAALDTAGYKFIVGSRQTKAPIDLESHFRWHGDAFTDAQLIDTLTPKIGRNSDNDPLKWAEPVWDPTQHPSSWRAIWAYSTRRAVRDRKALTAQENRARAVVDGEKTARTPRFVKTSKTGLALDQAALARATRLVGLKGYVTNIAGSVMPPAEVIASYHDLWRVEQSFRMSKSDLAARPLFARTRDAIEAHLTIVFTARAVSRTVQNRTGLSLRRVLRTLKPLRSADIEINGLIQTFQPALGPDETAILNALKQTDPRH